MEASSPSPPDILLFSALAQINPNIICIYLSKRYWWLLMCMQLGKRNKRQLCVQWPITPESPMKAKHHRGAILSHRSPREQTIFQEKQMRSSCPLLVTTCLQCLQISGCFHVSAANVPRVEKTRDDLHASPFFSRNSNSSSFMIISYWMKQKLCWFFILIQKIPLSRDSCYATKLCS